MSCFYLSVLAEHLETYLALGWREADAIDVRPSVAQTIVLLQWDEGDDPAMPNDLVRTH